MFREPTVPKTQRQTIRQQIKFLLEEDAMSTNEIASTLKIREKEVIEHLAHLFKSNTNIMIRPATCRDCDFWFTKRERLSTPSRCPLCKSEHIEDPIFWIGDI